MDLKRIALALCSLGLTGVASAGGFMPAPACSNQPVSVPCERSAWDFGLTAYWGRISSDYAAVDGLATEFGTRLLYITPDYRWGYGLEGSYHWGNGNDFIVEWTHFKKSFTENGSVEFGGEFANSGDDYIHRADFNFNSLNLALGQNIDVGSKWDMRAHAGLQYVKIERLLEYFYGTPAEFAANDVNLNTTFSRFSGTGPRVGIDGAYHLTERFSLTGNVAASVLVGKLRGLYTEYSVNSFGSSIDIHNHGRTHSVVGGLDGRFGARVDMPVSSGTLSLSGGYAGVVYFNTVTSNSLEDTADPWFTGQFGIGSLFLTAKYTS